MKPSDTTRRQLLGRALTIGLGGAVAACGGGGGGGGGFAGGVGGGGGGSGGGFTVDERSEATYRIAEKYEQLMAAKTEAPFEALQTWVRQQPQFDEVGIGAGSLWARFTDGRYFLFTDNWRNTHAAPPLALAAEPRQSDVAGLMAKAGKTVQVPGSDQAVLLKMMEDPDSFSPEGDVTLAKAKAALEKRGWRVPAQHALTVDALKNIGQPGLLYLNTHGAVFGTEKGRDAYQDYSITTDTFISGDLDEAYKDDLDSRRLIYHRDRSYWAEIVEGKRRPKYAVTSFFISKYIQLAPNSLVILMLCEGGLPQAAVFRAALNNVGAAEIVAWQGNSTADGYRTVDALFDRMTGVNANDPVAPANRAFDFEDVWAYLGAKGLLVNPASGEPGSQPAPIKRFGPGGFDLTNPVITKLEVEWKDKLIIHGGFGTEVGTVSVGGHNLPVATWGTDRIELMLPTAPNDPPGSHGDVVVTARKRTSNVRPLTSWRGQIEYLQEEQVMENATGKQTKQLLVDLHLRGDAYAIREQVDGPVMQNTTLLIAASDSQASYVVGGSIDRNVNGGGYTTSQQGQGTMKFVGNKELPSAGPGAMTMISRVNAPANELEISPLPTVGDYYREYTDGEFRDFGRLLFELDGLGFTGGNSSAGAPLLVGTAFPLAPDGSVAPYERTIVTQNAVHRKQQTVKTDGLRASPPWRPDVGL
ncbi:hypothetical protein J2W24_003140 [Variovorax boronicumulans]|uniref:hypothetical protein n=1 Tax=Variovorax boronicumulans TaxID=436515 RepID=UPI002788D911|nr:hypothetical protein [Variovorax boronicumulans]MDP9917489.1 hypothetical protein [Variovorax boronicumulans]